MPPEEVPVDPPAPSRAPRIREVTAAPIRAVSAAGVASGPSKPSGPSKSSSSSGPPKSSSSPGPSGPSKSSSSPGLSTPPARAPAASTASEQPCGDDELPKLRTPHRGTEPPPPKLRRPDDLRALVGRRESRAPLAAVAAWSRELGAPFTASSGAALVSWAAEAGRLRPTEDAPRPGDLLVFDQATSDDASDLVAVVLDQDDRGVTEFLYVAAGIVRRGLVDPSRPAIRRDASGATVNTFLRHGKRWPGKGMHYLAGELLGHIIRMR
jgi:hypothetical protein